MFLGKDRSFHNNSQMFTEVKCKDKMSSINFEITVNPAKRSIILSYELCLLIILLSHRTNKVISFSQSKPTYPACKYQMNLTFNHQPLGHICSKPLISISTKLNWGTSGRMACSNQLFIYCILTFACNIHKIKRSMFVNISRDARPLKTNHEYIINDILRAVQHLLKLN